MATNDPPVTGQHLGTELCKALGIELDGVRSITVHAVVGDAAVVTIEKFVRDSGGRRTAELMVKRFNLIDEVSA